MCASGWNSTVKSRSPAMKSSKFVASSAPAGQVLPPTVHGERSLHQQPLAMRAARRRSGTSMRMQLAVLALVQLAVVEVLGHGHEIALEAGRAVVEAPTARSVGLPS